MSKLKLLAVIASTALLSSCSTESIDWATPAIVGDVREQQGLLPTKTDLKKFSSLEAFSSAEFDSDVMTGMNFDGLGDGTLRVEPLSCLGSEKYLLTDDFWLTPTSTSTSMMGKGYSEIYSIRGDKQRSLRMAIFGDKNVEGANLIGDIAAELKSCKSVTNATEGLEWTSTFSYTAAAPDQLRVLINTEYTYSTGQKFKGLSVKLVKQVGRNLLSVMLSHTGKSEVTLDPITAAQEDDAAALLEIFAANLLPQE